MARRKTRGGLLSSRVGGSKSSLSDNRRGIGCHERQSSEDFSLNSSSTDSTRPTVHTERSSVPSTRYPGTEDESLLLGSAINSFNGTQRGHGIHANHRYMSETSSNHNANYGQIKTNPRRRVPGGAAAKLMLRGPQMNPSSSEASCLSTQYDSHDDGPVDTSEIFDMINRAKEEFETGPVKGRMSPVTIVGNEEIEVSFHCTKFNVASPRKERKDVPHILKREEAYHENASAAVAAILSPTRRDDASLASGMTDVYSTYSNSRLSTSDTLRTATAPMSAFQSPKYTDNGSMESDWPTEGHCHFDQHSQHGLWKSPTTEPLISGATEEKLDRMSQKMLDPSKTLSDLLRAIASPDDMDQLDRAYMVRRKNACGALKVLTAHNRRRKQICWTVGVLPALTSVLQDAGEDRLELIYPDVRTRLEYEEARRRAIAALTNLAMPVQNRLAVFHTPGLMQAVISVVLREDGECLEGTCAVLAYLAKSNENKILMAQVPGLFEAVLRVLRPKATEIHAYSGSPKRQEYAWESSVSNTETSVSSSAEVEEGEEDDASMLSASTDLSSGGETSDEEEDNELDAESTDDDVSTDRESMTGSEGSCESSVSESSGEDSESDYHSPAMKTRTATKNAQQRKNSSSLNHAKLVSPISNSSRTELHFKYDKDKHISGARKNLFAMLGHLAKEKDNAYRLVRVNDLVQVVVEISKMHDSPIHVLAVQLLAHLTRHRLNSRSLVFKMQAVIPAMVKATYSNSEATRRYACFAIQNFSHDKSCRQELASSEKLIIAICKRARQSKDPEERLAAICTLKNLTDEPANLIPLSNTAECIATLMQIAHGQEEGVTEMMQFRACDALATISHWLRKIATNGQSMGDLKNGDDKPVGMFVPSLKVIGWEQYE